MVKSIAELAQLKVSDAELPALAAAMQNILDLAEQMQAVETDGVEPVSNPLDAVQQFREDKVSETDNSELYQSLAPDTENGLYLVPRVVE
jgi:aspartyl-tRNA(Asn)/glutamyl-tRNA(Gln) amidotransferase subunit C